MSALARQTASTARRPGIARERESVFCARSVNPILARRSLLFVRSGYELWMDRRWSYQVPTTTTYCCILKPDNQVLILFPVRTCPVYSFLANNNLFFCDEDPGTAVRHIVSPRDFSAAFIALPWPSLRVACSGEAHLLPLLVSARACGYIRIIS